MRDDAPLLVEGLKDLAPSYDLLLCDVWGVIHNGISAYPAAAAALARFREDGKQVVLVSNAPRPGASVGRQLDRLGVARAAYDAILTSGDITRQAVIERQEQVLHHVGPPRDLPIFAGLDLRFGPIGTADYVVCTGFDAEDEGRESVESYRPRLDAMRRRDLWMLCANPDLVVERGDVLIPCAGALALAYEGLGGRVTYAGKPHRPVYEAALGLAARIAGGAEIAPARVLAIGDAIRTDIAGAAAMGLDSLLVARGIHAAELALEHGALRPEHVRDWIGRQDARPQGVMDLLVW